MPTDFPQGPIIPPIGYPSPGVPPFDITQQGNDARSILMEKMRRAIRGRNQGNTPLKSYEEQRKENENQVFGTSYNTTNRDGSRINPVTIGNQVNFQYSPTRSIPIIIVNLETGEKIQLQNVPKVLEYDTTSNWVPLDAMGRNNMLQHYTGGQDTLEMELDWYADVLDPAANAGIDPYQAVILNCKRVEALSKNDGYDKPPPVVAIIWGSDLFAQSYWVVKSANYKLSLFHKAQGMMPTQAYQRLVLVRVTVNNRTHEEIRSITK